jgi:beta-aspartyl-peptidase (threonine type)
MIHGGAWDIPESLQESHTHGVQMAYQKALELYDKNVDPLEIIAKTLKVMEDLPCFDAGTGSFLNEFGEVELDAAVMEGEKLRAGAIASIGSFKNPGQIAVSILKNTEHVLLVGPGAESYALSAGFEKVPSHHLIHPREIKAHKKWIDMGKPDAKIFFSKPENGMEPDKRGTVGVCIGIRKTDGNYKLFSGTSTGGTPGKKEGRVGDVPLVGCGLYADDETATISCTGWGEGLTRIAAAKSVCERVRAGINLKDAIDSTLFDLHRRTSGKGGIIGIDRYGNTYSAFTTPDMAFAGDKSEQLTFASPKDR